MDLSVTIGELAGGGRRCCCRVVHNLFLVCELTSLCTINIQKRAGTPTGTHCGVGEWTKSNIVFKFSLLPTVWIHHRLSRDTRRRLLLTDVKGPVVVALHSPPKTLAGPGWGAKRAAADAALVAEESDAGRSGANIAVVPVPMVVVAVVC